ncbi:MAG: restriction endonuclease subunit S [Prevotella sp.]|nr:restriction endonuclease subunit S [Prevotella sp.]
MEDTRIEKLGNYILDIAAGPFGSNLKVECFVPTGFPIIDGANLKGFKVTDNVSKFVTEAKARSLHRSIAKRNDVVVTISGNVGQISYIPEESAYEEYLVSQRQFRVTFDTSRVYVPYLVYYFHTLEGQHKILSFANQTGVPALAQPLKNFKNIDIVLPSLVEQQQIAEVLKSLDNKIEVNRRINDNLEQQAQALFKSWFVDFEPFRDQPFVESELGAIPQSLIMEYISNIPHTLETGRRPKGGVGELTSGVPSVGAEHVKGMGNYDYSKTKFIPADYASSLKTGKVNGYELLIYKDGGKPGYFIPNYSIFGEGYPYDECYLNEHVFKLDFGDRGYNAFCYFFFKTDFVMNYLNAQGGKAAIPGINRQDIENILVYSPQNEPVKDFGKLVLPMIKQILINCKESHRLAQLRDTLLPRLMSGELSVDGLKGQFAVSPGRCPGSNEHVSNKTAL